MGRCGKKRNVEGPFASIPNSLCASASLRSPLASPPYLDDAVLHARQSNGGGLVRRGITSQLGAGDEQGRPFNSFPAFRYYGYLWFPYA